MILKKSKRGTGSNSGTAIKSKDGEIANRIKTAVVEASIVTPLASS